MQFKPIFVIPKSRDWDATNLGIRDWRKRSRSRDSVSRDCNLYQPSTHLPAVLSSITS